MRHSREVETRGSGADVSARSRIRGHIVHAALDHVSPLAVPVILEIGRESVYGEASESLLA
jgi:hypothetical protein